MQLNAPQQGFPSPSSHAAARLGVPVHTNRGIQGQWAVFVSGTEWENPLKIEAHAVHAYDMDLQVSVGAGDGGGEHGTAPDDKSTNDYTASSREVTLGGRDVPHFGPKANRFDISGRAFRGADGVRFTYPSLQPPHIIPFS